MNMRLTVLFFFISLIGIFLNCSTTPQKAIIGSWKEINDNDIITFYTDGTILIKDNDTSVAGKYHFIDSQHIRIEFSGLVGGVLKFAEIFAGQIPLIFEISISRNRLIMIDTNGERSEFKKITYKKS